MPWRCPTPAADRCCRRAAWARRRLSFSTCVTAGANTPSAPAYTAPAAATSASVADHAAGMAPACRAADTRPASAPTNCRNFSSQTATAPIRLAPSAAGAKSWTIPTRHTISIAPADTARSPTPGTASAGYTPPARLAQEYRRANSNSPPAVSTRRRCVPLFRSATGWPGGGKSRPRGGGVAVDPVPDQVAERLGHQPLEHVPHVPLAGRDDLPVGGLLDGPNGLVQPLPEPLGQPPPQTFPVHSRSLAEDPPTAIIIALAKKDGQTPVGPRGCGRLLFRSGGGFAGIGPVEVGLAALVQGLEVRHCGGVVPVPPGAGPLEPQRQRLALGLGRAGPDVPPVG